LTETEKQAWVALLLSQPILVRRMNQVLASAGQVSMEVYDVLLTLEMAPGHRMKLTELADAALLSASGMTRLIDRLELMGLVVRQRCPDDRRSVLACLTEAGQLRREQAWETYEKGIVAHFATQLQGSDAEDLARILRPFLPICPGESTTSA
jgi:DNA-binding MarR family transcriptional regulator